MTIELKALIVELEKELLEPGVRAGHRDRVDALLADEFVEFGQSGTRYSKTEILNALPDFAAQKYRPSIFEMRRLSTDTVLLTYFLEQTDLESGAVRTSWRSSIWKKFDQNWRMLFHQGTRVSSTDKSASC